MKRLGDVLAALYFFSLLILVIWIVPGWFTKTTQTHPYIIGFAKFALLATFGEYLKVRIKQKKWQFDYPFLFIAKAFVWGIFGVWFTLIFPLFSIGVDGCIKAGLWPNSVLGIPEKIWTAFSKSLIINIIGLFAWTMMLFHEYLNQCLESGKLISGSVFGEKLDKKNWFNFIPLTIIFFWLPAHTITFSLPDEWRILTAAILSIVLGFLITLGKRKSN